MLSSRPTAYLKILADQVMIYTEKEPEGLRLSWAEFEGLAHAYHIPFGVVESCWLTLKHRLKYRLPRGDLGNLMQGINDDSLLILVQRLCGFAFETKIYELRDEKFTQLLKRHLPCFESSFKLIPGEVLTQLSNKKQSRSFEISSLEEGWWRHTLSQGQDVSSRILSATPEQQSMEVKRSLSLWNVDQGDGHEIEEDVLQGKCSPGFKDFQKIPLIKRAYKAIILAKEGQLRAGKTIKISHQKVARVAFGIAGVVCATEACYNLASRASLADVRKWQRGFDLEHSGKSPRELQFALDEDRGLKFIRDHMLLKDSLAGALRPSHGHESAALKAISWSNPNCFKLTFAQAVPKAQLEGHFKNVKQLSLKRFEVEVTSNE